MPGGFGSPPLEPGGYGKPVLFLVDGGRVGTPVLFLVDGGATGTPDFIVVDTPVFGGRVGRPVAFLVEGGAYGTVLVDGGILGAPVVPGGFGKSVAFLVDGGGLGKVVPLVEPGGKGSVDLVDPGTVSIWAARFDTLLDSASSISKFIPISPNLLALRLEFTVLGPESYLTNFSISEGW